MNKLKIDPKELDQYWVSSDFHFHHQNIVKGCSKWEFKDICRDFKSLDEHDQYLVKIINEHVKYNNILIFGGDWSFGGFEQIARFYRMLECANIHFILGNHDHHIENNREEIKHLFLSVQDRLKLEIKDDVFIIDHFPLETWDGIFKGYFHLFGHQHSSRIGPGRKMDIGIDQEGKLVTPYNLADLYEKMKKIEIKGGVGDSNIEVEKNTKR